MHPAKPNRLPATLLRHAILIALASFAGAAVILEKMLSADTGYKWSGISCFVGTMLLMLSAFGMRFGTLPPADI